MARLAPDWGYQTFNSRKFAPLSSRRTLISKWRISIATGVFVIIIFILYSSRSLISDDTYEWDENRSNSSQTPEESMTIPSPALDKPISSRKAAAIFETRPLHNLIPIILHFSSILGPEWPIHVFTSEENMAMFSLSVPFQRGLYLGRFLVKVIEAQETSGFFNKPWFWEQMAPAEHVLTFQANSVLCSRSVQKVEDFLCYDFVGAPVESEGGKEMGMSGGLSIRNRAKSLEVVRKYDWQFERHGDYAQGVVDEDQWFSKKMWEVGAKLAPTEVAMKFAVGSMWYDMPLGYHRSNVPHADRLEEIYDWCPEYRLCTKDTFTYYKGFGQS